MKSRVCVGFAKLGGRRKTRAKACFLISTHVLSRLSSDCRIQIGVLSLRVWLNTLLSGLGCKIMRLEMVKDSTVLNR